MALLNRCIIKKNSSFKVLSYGQRTNRAFCLFRLLGQAEMSLMFHHSFQKAPLELQLADRWTWYTLKKLKTEAGTDESKTHKVTHNKAGSKGA